MVIQHHAYWPANAHSKHLGLFAISEDSWVSLCSCSYGGVKGKQDPEQEGGRDPSYSIIPQRAAHFEKPKPLKIDRMRDQEQLESRCFGEMGRIFVAGMFIFLKAESN